MVEEKKRQRLDSEEQEELLRQKIEQRAKARDEYEQLMINSSFDSAYKKKPIVKSNSSAKFSNTSSEKRLSGKLKKI